MNLLDDSLLSNYVSPNGGSTLAVSAEGLRGPEGTFRFLPGVTDRIPDFRDLAGLAAGGRASLEMYDFQNARQIYRNFLSWMFRTFATDEHQFRADLIGRLRLRPGSKVLVTGCGIGDDVIAMLASVGREGMIFASDLAPEMVVATREALGSAGTPSCAVSLSVCDACHLPFADNFFDAAFHFGGINLFDDMRLAISEMARVTRNGGRVVFGDEGVAPWLAGTEYGRMVVANNHLWAARVPLEHLPFTAVNPSVSWILGNCFYLVEFDKDERGPQIDPDVPHVGRRGGSMRTRYFGQLEGVDPQLKKATVAAAAAAGLSVTEWLEDAVRSKLSGPAG